MAGETQPLLKDAMAWLPKASLATAVESTRKPGRFLPQTIAHRGYKASFPENTMGAFKGAAEVGAHAIETDLHLSADGVVVLSHDPTLKRCFGIDKKIIECTWEYISELKTLKEPKQGMPRFRDLLAWLNEPGNENLWVLLDVKVEDDADALLGAVARTLEDVPAATKPWDQRIVLGLWNATFIKAARKLLPTHPAVLICFHLPYAGHFFEIPNLGFNIFQRALVGFWGSRFLRKAQRANRPVLAWTVNDERWMEWCIRRNAAGAHSGVEKDAKTSLIDGVITDDPKLFREVCERWEDEQSGLRPARWRLFGGGVRNSLGVLWDLWIFTFFSRYFFFQGRRMGRFDYFKDVKKLQ